MARISLRTIVSRARVIERSDMWLVTLRADTRRSQTTWIIEQWFESAIPDEEGEYEWHLAERRSLDRAVDESGDGYDEAYARQLMQSMIGRAELPDEARVAIDPRRV